MDLAYHRQASQRGTVLTSQYQAFCKRKKIRILSVACYFGFAPFLWLAGVERPKSELLQNHFLHSLLLSLLSFFFVAAVAVTDALGIIHFVYLGTSARLPAALLACSVWIFDWMGNLIALTWLIANVICVLGAWRGCILRLPLLSRLTRHTGWMNFSLGWTIFLHAGFVFLVLISSHAAILTAAPGPSPQAYILYTVGGYIPVEGLWENFTPPRWTINTFFYPIILAASTHWGRGSVAVEPLSDVTFKKAIQNGRFIFVASHGGRDLGSFSYSFAPYGQFSPSDLQPGDASPRLRYVYIAGCFAGYREADWRQMLAPADIRVFPRISYVEEHFAWVWLKGAKVVFDIQ